MTRDTCRNSQMKIRRDVGPLDKRRRLTRCQHCARRRIKCQGGSPCENCTRTKKLCQPQISTAQQVQFVSCKSSEQVQEVAGLPLQVNWHPDTVYLDCFALFMQRCQFTKEFTNLGPDLYPLIQTCAPLREVTIAIGALEASRRGSVNSLNCQTSPHLIAFGSYCQSIQKLQDQLQSSDAIHSGGVLWCTLLLGLFELMTEVSGDGFAKHMLYGTCRILQSRGITSLSNGLDKQLFAAFRLLEANRAILYGEDTFLSQKAWMGRQQSLAAHSTSPVETIFDLVVQMTSFNKLLFEQVESIPYILRPNHPLIRALAKDGCRFQQRLHHWHEKKAPHVDCLDPYGKLALASYHALHLFLFKNFTFYSCWEAECIPSLSPDEIELHTTAVLAHSDDILQCSTIPGILLLFPLRMAGVNASRLSQRDKIMGMLGRISQNGFVVAERFKMDLEELWEYQRRGSGQVWNLN